MSKIKKVFENGDAIVPFFVCGDPNLEVTGKLICEAAGNGADMLVLGIPFSDPTAEVEVVQEANIRALANGVTTDKIFEFVKELRTKVQVPIVFMTYANVVFSYGADRFMAACKDLEIEGIILPDIPFEEKDEFAPICREYGVPLISMIAPIAEERMAMIAKEAEGFIYIISGGKTSDELGNVLKVVRENTDVPCMIGMENLDLSHAKQIAGGVDGVMADRALVQLVAAHGAESMDAVASYVNKMKQIFAM